jgi:hypothetical protein
MDMKGAEMNDRFEDLMKKIRELTYSCREDLEKLRRNCQIRESEDLVKLKSKLAEIEDSLESLSDKLILNPIQKFKAGRRLTKPEFHALMMLEVVEVTNKTFGFSDYDDFEVFDNLIYQSDELSCFTNPALNSEKSFGFGCAPERLHFENLRLQQKAFFNAKLPEIAQRFRR